MGERSLIAAIHAALERPPDTRVVRWIGDDCAVVRGDAFAAVSVDVMVDGTHFRLGEGVDAEDVGRRYRLLLQGGERLFGLPLGQEADRRVQDDDDQDGEHHDWKSGSRPRCPRRNSAWSQFTPFGVETSRAQPRRSISLALRASWAPTADTSPGRARSARR